MGGIGILSKHVCEFGGTLAESKHLDFLQQCLCSLGDRLLFQLHYCFAIERLLCTFPGFLLWKLSDVPSLAVIKAKIPIIWRWIGNGSRGYFCLNYLRFSCLKQQRTIMQFLGIRLKKNRPKVNEKDTASLITLIIIAAHLFSILAQIIKTIILNFIVKLSKISSHSVVYSRISTEQY